MDYMVPRYSQYILWVTNEGSWRAIGRFVELQGHRLQLKESHLGASWMRICRFKLRMGS
jgi:hypothetical protein